jgi:tRNA modification GTPase
MTNQTIAGIATPLGPGGIGIIRISGPEAYKILLKLFVRHKRDATNTVHRTVDVCFRSHVVYYGYLWEPGAETILDEVLAIYMRGPKSFTREDVVEIHSHSGFVVLDRILSAIIDAGAALAGPGEFSKRAFLNGRIDLSQAEAIIDLINAPCETAAQIASQQVAGGFRDAIETITNTVLAMQAKCEADIEFGEDIGPEAFASDFTDEITRFVLPEITRLIKRQKETSIFREGLHLAIVGVPNVGKSSLLNKLVEREAAIVSEVPGTTRDIVREFISINGVPVVVCDTAGIHETIDPVECIGIQKARAQIHQANIVLMVLDASRELNAFEETLFEELAQSHVIIVINKADIANPIAILDIEKKFNAFNMIKVSAKFGTNVDALKALIFKDYVFGKNHDTDSWVTPNLRQRKLLEKAKQELESAQRFVAAGTLPEGLSEKLDNVLGFLGEISGRPGKENLYDQIFSQFCIGK